MGGFPVEEEDLSALWDRARTGHAAERAEFVRLVHSILVDQTSPLKHAYKVIPGLHPDDLINRFTDRLLNPVRHTVSALDRERVITFYKSFLQDIRLDDLWRRRIDLIEPEWKQLYELVYSILHRQRRRFAAQYQTLSAHGLFEDDLIEDFFCDKVFSPAGKSSTVGYVHAGSLVGFYSNYLIDRLRRYHDDPVPWDDALANRKMVVERCVEHKQAEHVLEEAGLAPESVAESAKKFLAGIEPWALLMLGRSVCPDPDEAVPLYRLAREAAIPSYADRARKLGITVGRARFGEPRVVRESLLHGWIESFGIEVADENQAVILALLQILCQTALILVAGMEAR